MSISLQLRAPTFGLALQSPRLPSGLRATLERMIAARQAKADRIVEQHLARLGLQHPEVRGSQVAFVPRTTGGGV